MQKFGHQTGTPGFVIRCGCTKSRVPWPASAATTSHRERLNPATAATLKGTTTAHSVSSERDEPPITANRT